LAKTEHVLQQNQILRIWSSHCYPVEIQGDRPSRAAWRFSEPLGSRCAADLGPMKPLP
jgi:hypothetical protein